MTSPSRARPGFALVEVLVAGTLVLIIVGAGWSVAAVHAGMARRMVDGAGVLDEARLIRHLLASELGHARAGEDWGLTDGELHLRAFRGVAFACRGQPADGWGVAFSGYRAPDPRKDSVLVFVEGAGWRRSALVRRSRRRSLDCQSVPGFAREVWRLDPPRPGGAAALYFERGAYRFSDGAFRYRVGAGRWQPLTGPGIAADSAELEAAGARGVRARAAWERPGAAPESFEWTIWSRR